MRNHLTQDESEKNNEPPAHSIDIVRLRKLFLFIKSGAIRFLRESYGICRGTWFFRMLGKLILWSIGVVGSLCGGYLILYLLPGPKVITDFHKVTGFKECQEYMFNVLIPDDGILDLVNMTIQFPGRVEDHILTTTYYDVPSLRLGEGITAGENDTGCLFLSRLNQPSNVQFSLDSLSVKASVEATSLQGLLRSSYLISNQPLKELPSSEFVVKGYYEYRKLGVPIRKTLTFNR
jgi:hypothetical protein